MDEASPLAGLCCLLGLTASTLPQIGPPHPPDSILGGPTAPIPKRSVAPASDIRKLRSTEERLKCLTPNAPTEKPASAVSPIGFPALRELPTFPRVRPARPSLWSVNSAFSGQDRWLCGASLCSAFSNFRFGMPETGPICDGDRFVEPPA